MSGSTADNGHLSFDVTIGYLDASGRRTDRRVTVRALKPFDRPAQISGICHLRRALRTFWVHRIEVLTDPATGKPVADPAAWLRSRADGPQDGRPPEMSTRTKRQLVPSPFIEGRLHGWAFGVPEAFRLALDIKATRHVLSEKGGGVARELRNRGFVFSRALLEDGAAQNRLVKDMRAAGLVVHDLEVERDDKGTPLRLVVEVDTQGVPPVLDFTKGDVFYAPADIGRNGLPGRPTQEFTEMLAVADGGGGDLIVRHTRRLSNGSTNVRVLDCTQEELLDLLRHGFV